MNIVGSINVQTKMEDVNYAAIAGKTVTLSYSVDGAVTTDTFVAPVVSGHPTVVDLNLSNCVLNWVKLEEGDRATPFKRRHYDTENLACKRYQRVLSGCTRMSFMYGANGNIYFHIPLDVTMRITPTLSVRSEDYVEVRSTTFVDQSGFNIRTDWGLEMITIIASKLSHGMSDAILRYRNIILDANM